VLGSEACRVTGDDATRKSLNIEYEKEKANSPLLTFFTMPHCSFCGKLCTTASGLERHVLYTPNCKKASSEEFNQYANSIWDNVPANPNHAEQPQLVNVPSPNLPPLPDFDLEDDLQIAEDMLNSEEINLPPPPPPPQEPPPHAQGSFEAPNNEDENDGGGFIEHFPKEYKAGATWGDANHCLSLLMKSGNGLELLAGPPLKMRTSGSLLNG
jgi:hypothetical protein